MDKAQEISSAFESNNMLYFLAGDEYGILANTMENINIAGFSETESDGRDIIVVYLKDNDNEIDEILYQMEVQGRGRNTTVNTGIIPTIVGRDQWRIGFVLQGTGDARILLDVLDVENSKKLANHLKDPDMVVSVEVRPQEYRNSMGVTDALVSYFDMIGDEIDIEEAAERIGPLEMSIV